MDSENKSYVVQCCISECSLIHWKTSLQIHFGNFYKSFLHSKLNFGINWYEMDRGCNYIYNNKPFCMAHSVYSFGTCIFTILHFACIFGTKMSDIPTILVILHCEWLPKVISASTCNYYLDIKSQLSQYLKKNLISEVALTLIYFGTILLSKILWMF